MKTTWFVQTNMSESYWSSLKTACEEVGRDFVGFTLIPFSHEIVGIDPVDPFVLMGSTTLHTIGVDSLKFNKGLFFDYESFKPSTYLKHHSSNMLNDDLAVTLIKDVKNLGHKYSPDSEIFIRSNNDSKQISGGTCVFQDLLDISKNTEEFYLAGDLMSPDSEVCIASVKDIISEYRLVFIEDNLISCSQYRPEPDSFVEEDVKTFAKECAKKWTPNAVCVMDVARTGTGLKIIEFNSFNGSGFYKCNLANIIQDVSNYKENK